MVTTYAIDFRMMKYNITLLSSIKFLKVTNPSCLIIKFKLVLFFMTTMSNEFVILKNVRDYEKHFFCKDPIWFPIGNLLTTMLQNNYSV